MAQTVKEVSPAPTVRIEPIAVGDRVNWLYVPRGGWGYAVSIAAVVERIGPVMVQVRIAVRHPLTRCWHTEFRWVPPAHLSLRTVRVPQVDEAVH
jgi:hypothetical protein